MKAVTIPIFLLFFTLFRMSADDGLSHEIGVSAGSAYINYNITASLNLGLNYNIYFPKVSIFHFGIAVEKGFGEKDFLLSYLTLFLKPATNFKFGLSFGYYSESKYSKSPFYDETIRYYGAFLRGSFNFLIPVNKFTISPIFNLDLFRRDYFASMSINVSYPLPN